MRSTHGLRTIEQVPPYPARWQKLPSPLQILAEVSWARQKLTCSPTVSGTLLHVNTHPAHCRGSFYWHYLNYIVTVQWLSTLCHQHTVLLIREGMHNRERELHTHKQCFSDAQHKNLIKIVPEWWCEKHPAKSVINIKFISYISTMYHLSFRSTLHIVGTQMNPQIRTDLYWNLTFLLASHSFKLQP